MWKRFNGSDAARNALQACLLAQVGVEAAVRPFVGKCGFIQKMSMKDDPVPVLRDCLDPKRPLSRVNEAFMKRWPVGSVAQSAIRPPYRRGRGSRIYRRSGKFACLPRMAPTTTWSRSARTRGIPSARTADHSALSSRRQCWTRHHGQQFQSKVVPRRAAGLHQENTSHARAGAGLHAMGALLEMGYYRASTSSSLTARS
jgi:hypothetical protein